MALVPNFETSQVLGLPSQIVFTDTSTGSDSGLTTRRIYMLTANGTYLVETGTTTDYEVWALPLATDITLDVLTQDMCLSIRVDWMTGSTVTYTKTILCLFTLYNKTFYYGLTQYQAANPTVLQDANYFANKAQLWTNITSAINATEIGGDIYNAQASLDAATYLVNNENLFF